MDMISHSSEYLDVPLKHGSAHLLTGAQLHEVLKVFCTGYLSSKLNSQQGIFLACADVLLTV